MHTESMDRGYYVPMIRKTGQPARTFTLHTSKRFSSAEDARPTPRNGSTSVKVKALHPKKEA